MNQVTDRIVRIEISDEKIIPGRNGSNERGAYTIPAKQVGYLWQGDRYPTRMEIAVPENGPRKPGLYLLAGKCFAVGDYGRVKFTDREMDLVSVDEFAADLKGPSVKAA